MGHQRPSRVKNLTYAATAGQAGCASVVIIIIALFIGIWLDGLFGRRGPCTIGMLVLSVPFSLYTMLRIALRMIEKINPQPHTKQISSDTKEDYP